MRSLVSVALVLCLAGGLSAQDKNFQRGDSNADGGLDLSDGVRVLLYLFVGGVDLPCEDAADSNDSGKLDVADATYTLAFLFQGGGAPPAPFAVCGADPTPDTLTCQAFVPCPDEPPPSPLADIGHVLNRAGYGPSPESIADVEALGLEGYIESQLDPASIDESGNTALNARESNLFYDRVPSHDVFLVRDGEIFKYRKGTSQPPASWKTLAFDDSGADWLEGPTGIGYGDGDDLTVLEDMRDGYWSVALRKVFHIDDVGAIDDLVLRVRYDDGFAAYLNGTEVVRASMPGGTLNYNTAANSHEAEGSQEFNLTSRKNLFSDGDNVLAIEVHNTSLGSSDLSMVPELINREILPGEPVKTIDGIDALQQLVHVRGVYSRRQFQEVLAEFWENHFTTDYDKVKDYLDDLQNSDANDALSTEQAAGEAAQIEYLEYEFFRQNALGKFGDLLLFSATSPTQLIYLDNVLNFKAEPNENYAREIFELYGFGVDNRYTQRDIEELARCFTGWFVCKVEPESVGAFPERVRTPPTDCGVQFTDTQFLGLGGGWKYFKGTAEPTPDVDGEPTTAWTAVDFDDSTWLNGSTGIGYGDGDDVTVLSDMRNNYYSVYLRREFTVDDPEAFENLIIDVEYDDGFVAYLNGYEVGRSENMEGEGEPPAYNEDPDDGHEVTDGNATLNLNRFLDFLRPSPQTNVLAIQVHNVNLGSSDLSMRPTLQDRHILPGSVENGDPNAVWHFRFDPNEHDTGQKILFQGQPHQMVIPAGRVGAAGVQDALDVIDMMANFISTKEFICIKLIQKFVSDEISLATFKGDPQSVPIELRELLADCIDAWSDTDGSIEAVMRVILDPQNRESAFWSSLAYRSKIKTPIEFVNSSLRVLDSSVTGNDLPGLNDDMGMHLFTRDEPDGWPEDATEFNGTATALARTSFVRELSDNSDTDYRWSPTTYMQGLNTAEEIVDAMIEIMFQGAVPAANRDLLIEYVTTDANGNPLPFSRSRGDFNTRLEELIGLMLTMPQWQFQ